MNNTKTVKYSDYRDLGSLPTHEDAILLTDSQDVYDVISDIPGIEDQEAITGVLHVTEHDNSVSIWITESGKPYELNALYYQVKS